MPDRKFNFGCGSNHISGWENYDREVDISLRLPFPSECTKAIFAEHVVEHLTHQQAWNFFEECYRLLSRNGNVRITVPSVPQLVNNYVQAYGDFVASHKWGEPTLKGSVWAIIFKHEHKSAWSEELLHAMLTAVGFQDATSYRPKESKNPEMQYLEGHGKRVGDLINNVESICVEAKK